MNISRTVALQLTIALAACSPNSTNIAAMQSPAELELRTAEAHAAAGRLASEPDFPGLATLCGDPSPAIDPARINSRPYSLPEAVAPAKVFDNLYFVGNRFTTAWVIKTDDGLVLIDALTHEAEVQRDIEGGMAKLGLDPADIRYVVISHGHGDHSGGAAYLGAKYHPKFIMSRTDWEISQDPQRGIQLPGWNNVPTPDILVDDSYVLELGGSKIQLIVIPGHTPGTLAAIFEVRDGDARDKAVFWGGTGFNFGPKAQQYRDYANSAETMRQRVLAQGVDVFLSNHVARDRSDKRIEALAVRQPGAPHPFVATPERVSKAFEVFRECSLSQLAKIN